MRFANILVPGVFLTFIILGFIFSAVGFSFVLSYAFGCVCAAFATGAVAAAIVRSCRRRKKATALSASTPSAAPVANISTKRRLYCLDHLKCALTALVVLHHSTAAFAGSGWVWGFANYRTIFLVVSYPLLISDQAFFMPLFFFIAALFTPGSYARIHAAQAIATARRQQQPTDASAARIIIETDAETCDGDGEKRKERRRVALRSVLLFLQSKSLRLGVPFTLYTFALGPATETLVHFAGQAKDASTYTFKPSVGPAWFLAWLLLFNAVYASAELVHAWQPASSSSTNAKSPNIAARFVEWLRTRSAAARIALTVFASLVLGALQAVVMGFGGGSFMLMPISFGSLPFDCAFYAAGVCAAKSGLFDSVAAQSTTQSAAMSPGARWWWSWSWLVPGDSSSRSSSTSTSAVGLSEQSELSEALSPGKPSPMKATLGKSEAWTARLVAAIGIAGIYAGIALAYALRLDLSPIIPSAFTTPPNTTRYAALRVRNGSSGGNAAGGDFESSFVKPSSAFVYSTLCGTAILLGVYCIALSVALLDAFHRRCNAKGGALRVELARSAYCVYIIHPAVLIPLEYAFERLLMLITGVNIARQSTWDHTHSSVALGGSNSGVKFIFVGWLLVALTTQLVVWPLAMVVRRLPLLRRVL